VRVRRSGELGRLLREMMAQTFDIERLEKRIPMTVAVHISGHQSASYVETTFTEDVSSRGARVPSIRRWRPNETLNFESLPGDFHALARVAYCRPHREGYVIGLEFLEPSGRWVVNAPVGSGKPLQG
jgi:hypothetical protein